MYSIFFARALCIGASARPALKNHRFLGHAFAGVGTGITCTDPEECVNGDIILCINGEFIVSQSCAVPTMCLDLPHNNTTTNFTLGCTTPEIQTTLVGLAFEGVDKIPLKR
ncbi:hypothetical protein K438DRAFT_1976018 [Mycena galopus ATCC 62051]|nr:hypothetical protein K438DRAFT_1976018 [Mycena galopus ATCC 62051]